MSAPPPGALPALAVPPWASARPGGRSPARGPIRLGARGAGPVEAVEHERQVASSKPGPWRTSERPSRSRTSIARRPPGSTSPRCRAGWRPRGRSGRPRRARASARARRSSVSAAPAAACARPPPRRSRRRGRRPGRPAACCRGPARPRRRPAPSARRAPRSRRGAAPRDLLGESSSSSRSSWMLARSVAIGVRSSWEASATRLRWDCTDRSSASSVRLNVCASRASSSLPVTSSRSDSSRSGLRGDRLGLPGEAGDRRQRRARHEQPEQRGERDPAGGDHDQQQQLAATARGRPSVSGSATSSAPREPSPCASTRSRVPLTVDVGEVAARCRGAASARIVASTGSFAAPRPAGRTIVPLRWINVTQPVGVHRTAARDASSAEPSSASPSGSPAGGEPAAGADARARGSGPSASGGPAVAAARRRAALAARPLARSIRSRSWLSSWPRSSERRAA